MENVLDAFCFVLSALLPQHGKVTVETLRSTSLELL